MSPTAFTLYLVFLAPFVAILAIVAVLVWATLRNERIRGRFRRATPLYRSDNIGPCLGSNDAYERPSHLESDDIYIIGPAGTDMADPLQSAGLYENPAGRIGTD